MKLEFLGRGGAFFVEEGNTSAYFIEDKTLFLIDCGESVFSKIVQLHLLEENQIEAVVCFITHMHSDHTGSLSSLIYYCTYALVNSPLCFMIVCHNSVTKELKQMLAAQGCAGFYSLLPVEVLSNHFRSFNEVRFIRTAHQLDHPASCIEFTTDNGKVFYSGDTRDLELIRSYVQNVKDIERIYLETTLLDYPGNAHLPLRGLNEIIPKNLRRKVYLMHFNNADCIAKAKELGFRVVRCVRKTNHG